MQLFRTILVVCEEAGVAAGLVARVRRLASAEGASVILLAIPQSGAPSADTHSDRIDMTRLDVPARSLRAAGLEVVLAVAGGSDTNASIRHVLTFGSDLVVTESGPSDLSLLRHCPCPVWIVADNEREQGAGLLAVVDPDPEDPVRDVLNRRVLRIANALAETAGAPLDVLSVWHLPEEAALRHSLVRNRPEEVDRVMAAEERQSAWRLGLLMRDFAGFSDRMTVHHRKGVASEIIPQIAGLRGVDTIVIGAIARSDKRGPFVGKTAETILGSVGCSVLTVKPEGFVSPVELET
ncbi:universal stress protein [Histidinibacterium lentulum]|uniref:universal stress protein n=1 Tax=Histidinibacterium lentulum TaxID=2480588 RepID=UPI001608A043|nr:universal stress protein [Histidinibacterium lentulum]